MKFFLKPWYLDVYYPVKAGQMPVVDILPINVLQHPKSLWSNVYHRTPKNVGSKLCNRLLQSFLLRSTFLAKKATGIAFVIVASRWSASSNTDFHATKWFETTTNLKQSPAKFSASPPFLLNFSAQPASNLRALWRNCALCKVLKAAATAIQTSKLKTKQYNAHGQFGKLNPS